MCKLSFGLLLPINKSECCENNITAPESIASVTRTGEQHRTGHK